MRAWAIRLNLDCFLGRRCKNDFGCASPRPWRAAVATSVFSSMTRRITSCTTLVVYVHHSVLRGNAGGHKKRQGVECDVTVTVAARARRTSRRLAGATSFYLHNGSIRADHDDTLCCTQRHRRRPLVRHRRQRRSYSPRWRRPWRHHHRRRTTLGRSRPQRPIVTTLAVSHMKKLRLPASLVRLPTSGITIMSPQSTPVFVGSERRTEPKNNTRHSGHEP